MKKLRMKIDCELPQKTKIVVKVKNEEGEYKQTFDKKKMKQNFNIYYNQFFLYLQMEKYIFVDVHTAYFYRPEDFMERFENLLEQLETDVHLQKQRSLKQSLDYYNNNSCFFIKKNLRSFLFYAFEGLDDNKYVELQHKIYQSQKFIVLSSKYDQKTLFQVQDEINPQYVQSVRQNNMQLKGYGSKNFPIIQQILEKQFLVQQFGKDFLAEIANINQNNKNMVYCISRDVDQSVNFIQNVLKISDWQISKQMMYFCNFCINQNQEEYEQQFNKYNLQNCIMSLQTIESSVQQSEKFETLKKVALAVFDKNIYKHIGLLKNQQIQFYPLDLTFTRKQKIDAILGKTSSLLKFFKVAKINDLNHFHNLLQNYLQKNDSQNAYNNLDFQIDEIYFDRVKLQQYFDKRQKEDDFQKMLNKENIKVNYPKQLYFETCNFDIINQKIKENSLNYPILTKPRLSVSGLIKNSHFFSIIQTEKGLKQFTEEQSEMKDFIIQEFVVDCSSTFKIYRIFDTDYLKVNNEIALDLLNKNYQEIDCKVALKDIVHIDQKLKDKKIEVFSKLSKILQSWGFENFGIDIVQKRGTNEYFLLDINCKPIYFSSKNDTIQVPYKVSINQLLKKIQGIQ